jgi:hypothetical protein
MAYRTNGKFFDVHTGGRLDEVFLRIDEMLNNEAIVRVIDPDPDDEPGKLKITARKPRCMIQVFRARQRTEDALALPLERPWVDLPKTIDLPPDPRYLRDLTNRAHYSVDPECARESDAGSDLVNPIEGLWRAEIVPGAIRGCSLDVTMDVGPLYDLSSMAIPDPWSAGNAFLKTKTRQIEVLAPALGQLPGDPVEVARRLAERAVEVADAEIERDSRKKPYDRHARPYDDIPTVVHGRTFFDLRERLAVALFSMPAYRGWALDRLAAEADTDLRDLRERFRRRVPSATEAALDDALEQSEEGRRIRDRASNPSPLDLSRHLSAWLGDVPANDLFERWESERIEAFMLGTTGPDDGSFSDRWEALRELLFAPSYTRELTLLTLAHDRRTDRIGFYRVVLPRPAWYLARIRNYQNHPGWTDLPFDLVPDRPVAFRSFARLADDVPRLVDELRSRDYRVVAVEYDSFAKPRKQSPVRALRQARVAVELASEDGRLRIEFDVERDGSDSSETTLVDVRLTAEGDPVIEALAAAARDRTKARILAEAGG